MSLRAKFKTALWTAAIASALIMAVVLWSYQALQSAERDAAFANGLNADLVKLDLLTSELLLHSSPRVRNQWQRQHARVTANLASGLNFETRVAVLVDELRRRSQTIGKLFQQIERPLVTQAPVDKRSLEATRVLYSSILAQSAAMHSRSLQMERLTRDAAVSLQGQVSLVVLAGFLTIIIGGVFLFARLLRTLLNRVVQLRDVIGWIGKGHLDRSVPDAPEDEMGDVFRDLDKMRSQLRSTTRELRSSNAALTKAKDELEMRVQERTADLETVNEELETFAYSVSHDLRAPLRSIDGFSMALVEDYAGTLDDGGKDMLRRVREATVKMGELIDDILKLSRVTRTPVQAQDVNLSDMAQEISDRLQGADPRRDVKIDIVPSVSAKCDPQLMHAALTNLLDNAWKYTGKQPKAKIEFGRAEANGKASFFVRDNGAGFDMAYAEKLFKPFQRLHAASDFPGNGIGLATVARIIRRHGGKIEAESSVGNGTTITFTL